MRPAALAEDVALSEVEMFDKAYAVRGIIPCIAIFAPDGTVRHAGLNLHDPSADIAGKVEIIRKAFKLASSAPWA